MKKSKPYQPDLIESLRNPQEAEEYLNVALEEEDPELFLLALRNVTEAQGGVARLAEKTKLNRESLYKMLSERGESGTQEPRCVIARAGFPAGCHGNSVDEPCLNQWLLSYGMY